MCRGGAAFQGVRHVVIYQKEVEFEIEKAKKELEEEYYWKVQEYVTKMEEEKQRFLEELKAEERKYYDSLKVKLEKLEQEYINETNAYKEVVEKRIPSIVDYLLDKLIEK